jgi:hypothetical protein
MHSFSAADSSSISQIAAPPNRAFGQYAIANAALAKLAGLGQLADEEVDQLRKTLRKDAADWRSRIYLGAFPDTAHELIDTGMDRKGELDLVVQTGGVAVPAQHVTNASALRASLVAFFLAFWEHVLKERGGLITLVLDHPQELLDDENRERLAAALFSPASCCQRAINRDLRRFALLQVCVLSSDTRRHRTSRDASGDTPAAPLPTGASAQNQIIHSLRPSGINQPPPLIYPSEASRLTSLEGGAHSPAGRRSTALEFEPLIAPGCS